MQQRAEGAMIFRQSCVFMLAEHGRELDPRAATQTAGRPSPETRYVGTTRISSVSEVASIGPCSLHQSHLGRPWFNPGKNEPRSEDGTPTIVPGGLNACAKFSRRSEVEAGPNWAMKGFAAVSSTDAPQPTVNSAIRKGRYFRRTAAGQKSTIPPPEQKPGPSPYRPCIPIVSSPGQPESPCKSSRRSLPSAPAAH